MRVRGACSCTTCPLLMLLAASTSTPLQPPTPSTPRRAPAAAPASSRPPWRCRCTPMPLSRRGRCSTWRHLPPSTAPTSTDCRATQVGGGCAAVRWRDAVLACWHACGSMAAVRGLCPYAHELPAAVLLHQSSLGSRIPPALFHPPLPHRQGHPAASALDCASQLCIWGQ